jgi:hypothetical protein
MMQTYQRASESVTVVDEVNARDVLRRAFESTYRWSPEFKGFAARLSVWEAGKRSDGDVRVELPDVVTVSLLDDETRKWVEGQIGMMAVHRGHRAFDQADGRHTLTLGEDDGHPLGRLLLIHGDGMNSRYRVLVDQIRQINRSMGPVRFTINVEDSTATADGRRLTTRYTVYYFNPQDGAIKQVDSITDVHAVVDGVYLPGTRRVIGAENGAVRVRMMEFSGHQLL